MKTLSVGPSTVLSAATTGTSLIVPCHAHVSNLTVMIIGTGTITAGGLRIEECYSDPDGSFGGTWSDLVGSEVDLTQISAGKQIGYHFGGTFWDVRVRVSTNVTGGGSITVVIFGA